MSVDIEATFQRGFEFRCGGQYDLARVEFTKVLAQDPQHFKSIHQMGLIQGFEGDFDGSLATLQGLCDGHPENIEIRYDLAMTQMMLGMSDEACANFKKILAVDPTHEKAKQQVIYCP